MPDQQASLYEHLFALTVLMKQRMVERFSGDALDERWQFTNIAGTGSSVIDDAIDGGFKITTGATDDDESAINFNDIRQYSEIAAIVILIASAIANTRFRAGFSENTDMSNSFALADMDADNVNYELSTDDGTTESSSASDVIIGTIARNNKIECGSANIKYTINGVLKVTKTTNRPDFRQQPYFAVKARSTGAKTGSIRFMEAFGV